MLAITRLIHEAIVKEFRGKSRFSLLHWLLLLILLTLSSCDIGPQAQVGYKPPFLPVIFSLDASGAISVEGDASISTFIGDFSVNAGGFASLATATPTPEKLTIIIRHLKNKQAIDSVYTLNTSEEEVSVTTDGLTQITVTSHQVFIDATKSVIKSIKIKDVRPLIYSLGDANTHFGSSLSWSPDGKFIAVTDLNNVQIFSTRDDSQVLTLSGDMSDTLSPSAVSWSPNGKYIAVASNDNQIYIFDATTGGKAQKYPVPVGVLGPLDWSPDSRFIAYSDLIALRTDIVDAFTGKRITSHEGILAFNASCAWSPDETYMVVTSQDGATQVWDTHTGQTVASFAGKWAGCLSPDSKHIVSLSQTGAFHIFDTFTGKNDHVFKRKSKFESVSWSPDGKRILSLSGLDSSSALSVEIWNAQTGNTIVTYPYPYETFQYNGKTEQYIISDAHWSPDGTQVAILFRNEVTIQSGTGG